MDPHLRHHGLMHLIYGLAKGQLKGQEMLIIQQSLPGIYQRLRDATNPSNSINFILTGLPAAEVIRILAEPWASPAPADTSTEKEGSRDQWPDQSIK